ncbi:MAG: hypothetical protein WA082_03535 [Candidatus Moraniibacteriota bacterium]
MQGFKFFLGRLYDFLWMVCDNLLFLISSPEEMKPRWIKYGKKIGASYLIIRKGGPDGEVQIQYLPPGKVGEEIVALLKNKTGMEIGSRFSLVEVIQL